MRRPGKRCCATTKRFGRNLPRVDFSMRQVQVGFLAITLTLICLPTIHAAKEPEMGKPGDHHFSLNIGGVKRKYLVHVPKSYEGKDAVPVVVMIHGAGGTSDWTVAETGWGDKGGKKGLLPA